MLSDNARATINAYFTELRNLLEEFNFTRPGKDHVLGKDIAHVVANGIFDRTISKQAGPAGTFPPNDAGYTARKLAQYKVELIGVRTGQMVSIPSLLGKVQIEPLRVTIAYGTDMPPTRGMTGYISEQDKKVTDTQKAEWFTAKKGDFYELDDQIAEKVCDKFAERLDEYIDYLNHQS